MFFIFLVGLNFNQGEFGKRVDIFYFKIVLWNRVFSYSYKSYVKMLFWE